MATSSTHHLDHVLSHWHHSLDNFSASSADFYTLVEEGVKRRGLPEDVQITRVEFPEGGAFSALRTYLRASRLGFHFDVCAAPFGSGFFLSSWLVKPPPGPALLAFAIAATVAAWTLLFRLCMELWGPRLDEVPASSGLIHLFAAYLASVVAYFLLLHLLVHAGMVAVDTARAIPGVGYVYGLIFAPPTYYHFDTAQMFADSIHGAVLEAVEQITEGKGVRALTDLERKPVMRALLG